MSLVKLRIFDLHEKHVLTEENEVRFIPVNDPGDESEWKRFDLYFEAEVIRIDAFREYVLFDKEGMPQRCTKVNFNDGSFVFACSATDTFVKFYNEDYLPATKAVQ